MNEFDPFGKHNKFNWLKNATNITLIVMFSMALLLFGFDALFFQIQVKGRSMKPTYIGDGSEIAIVSRYSRINRGDIVIIQTSNDTLIKRAVAIGGDKISLVKRSDSLYCYYVVNGEVIDESYLEEHSEEMGVDYFNRFKNLSRSYVSSVSIGLVVEETATIDLEADEIFALGDNRGDSEDSTKHGPFKMSQVLGKVISGYKI